MANPDFPAFYISDDHRRQAYKELGWFLTSYATAMASPTHRRIIETRAQRIADAQARAGRQALLSPQPPMEKP